MSGIAGVVRLDGAPVDPALPGQLAAAIAHRGTDASAAWREGPVAFVHASLRTTAEASPQPFVDGDLVISADVRLDNREELTRLLGVAPEQDDPAFLAAAYRRWGADCASRLEGDFSFALWDRGARVLFAARDAFGVKPFVYAFEPGKLFAFGSEVRAVLAHEDVSRRIDEKRVADFLTLHFDDRERTFHEAVRRLPGGHSLLLRDGAVSVTRYWYPENVPDLRLKGATRHAEYAAGFLEHFGRAVRSCMRAASPSQIGAMMSGGLDSSSIACFARDELRARGGPPLPIWSWVFSDVPAADEREFQAPVIATGGFRPFTLDSAGTGGDLLWRDVDALLPNGPPYAPNHYLTAVAARQARAIGVRILLDGLGGDLTVSRGGARFAELLGSARIVTLIREAFAMKKRSDTGQTVRGLLASAVSPFLPAALHDARSALQQRGGDPALRLLTPRMLQLRTSAHDETRRYRNVRSHHEASFTAPLIAEGLELFDRFMAAAGVEGRYPFFDRRLAEYCLSLPADQKLADGFSRVVVRRAMEGIVPPEVQWRAGKGRPAEQIAPALRASEDVLDGVFLRDASILEPYVEIEVVRRSYAALRSGKPVSFATMMGVWNAAILALWLRRERDRNGA